MQLPLLNQEPIKLYGFYFQIYTANTVSEEDLQRFFKARDVLVISQPGIDEYSDEDLEILYKDEEALDIIAYDRVGNVESNYRPLPFKDRLYPLECILKASLDPDDMQFTYIFSESGQFLITLSELKDRLKENPSFIL